MESQQKTRIGAWWPKRLIALRKRYRAFGRGTIRFLAPNNRKVLAFTRHHEDQHLLLVANLSRFVQFVELDLSAYKGMAAVELFGRTEFPPIGDQPYLLTLGPHAFYWFSLEPPHAMHPTLAPGGEATPPPVLSVRGSWEAVLRGEAKAALERALPAHLAAGPGRRTRDHPSRARSPPLRDRCRRSPCFHLRPVEYKDGRSDTTRCRRLRGRTAERDACPGLSCQLWSSKNGGATRPLRLSEHPPRPDALDSISRKRGAKGSTGEIAGVPTSAFRSLRGESTGSLAVVPLKGEHHNTTLACGQRLALKLFRRVQEGVHPEVEIGRFLTERKPFTHVAPLAGHLGTPPARADQHRGSARLRRQRGRGLRLHGDEIGATRDARARREPCPRPKAVSCAEEGIFRARARLLGAQLESARLLGQRRRRCIALSLRPGRRSRFRDAGFTAQPALAYQSLRNLTGASPLAANGQALPARASRSAGDRARTETVRGVEVLTSAILRLADPLHGDYHLAQLLYTGRDFAIIDFEGEAIRQLADRRRKRSAAYDLAPMILSFEYAAHAAELRCEAPAQPQAVESALRFWYWWFSSAFLNRNGSSRGKSLSPERRRSQALRASTCRTQRRPVGTSSAGVSSGCACRAGDRGDPARRARH